MNTSTTLRTRAPLALAAMLCAPLLLTACGGGGGGDASQPAPSAPVASQLVITEANQQAVASQAVEVTQQGTATASLGSSLATGVQATAGPRGPIILGAVAQKLLTMVPQGQAQATGVTRTDTANCTGGGTATVTATKSDTSGALVAGDSVSIVARSCVEVIDGGSVRLDGGLSLTATAGSFDPVSAVFPKDVTLRMVATNLSLDNVQMNGTMELHLLQASAALGTVSLSSPVFTWKVTGASGTETLTLRDYNHRVEQATVDTASMQISVTVETDSSRLGSGVSAYAISTPEPVVVNTLSGTGMLLRGVMKVTGKQSALLVTVTGNDTLQLQVDANGDGAYDTTRTLSRFQL